MFNGPTEDQEQLREVTRRFLADKASPEAMRALVEAGERHDDRVWAQMATQLGLHGLALPEEHGGAGLGPVELGIVLEEMGRAVYVGPFFSTVALAGQLLTAVDDPEAGATWLPRIADGSLTATVAISDRDGSFDVAGVTSQATQDADGWRVCGTKEFVVDGEHADLVLLAARAGDEVVLLGVEGTADGLTREAVDGLDPTRPFARLVLEDVPARRIAGDVAEVLPQVGDLVAAALACEQIGGAARALDMAVGYAQEREQFGRPIGSFQAIKHKCADLLVEIESGRSAALAATELLAEGDAEGPVAAAVAQAWCGAAYNHAAKENIQIHGGIGYTWEHDAHFHLKRAKTSELLLGTTAVHRVRVAELAGIRGN